MKLASILAVAVASECRALSECVTIQMMMWQQEQGGRRRQRRMGQAQPPLSASFVQRFLAFLSSSLSSSAYLWHATAVRHHLRVRVLLRPRLPL